MLSSDSQPFADTTFDSFDRETRTEDLMDRSSEFLLHKLLWYYTIYQNHLMSDKLKKAIVEEIVEYEAHDGCLRGLHG